MLNPNAGSQDEYVPTSHQDLASQAGAATDLQCRLEQCTYASATCALSHCYFMVDGSENWRSVQSASDLLV